MGFFGQVHRNAVCDACVGAKCGFSSGKDVGRALVALCPNVYGQLVALAGVCSPSSTFDVMHALRLLLEYNERAAEALAASFGRARGRKELVRLCALSEAARTTLQHFPGLDAAISAPPLLQASAGMWSVFFDTALERALFDTHWSDGAAIAAGLRSAPRFPGAPAEGVSRGDDVFLIRPSRLLPGLARLSRYLVPGRAASWGGAMLQEEGRAARMQWWTAEHLAAGQVVQESAEMRDGGLAHWQTQLLARDESDRSSWDCWRRELRSPEGVTATVDFAFVFGGEKVAQREWRWAVLRVRRSVGKAPGWFRKLFSFPELVYAPDFALGDAVRGRFVAPIAAVAAQQGDERVKEGTQSTVGAGEELAGRVLTMEVGAGKDPRGYWAVERTLFSWLSAAIMVALGASGLQQLNSPAAKVGAFVLGLDAVVLASYPLLRWHFRLRALAEGLRLAPFVDFVGPAIAGLLLLGMLVMIVTLSIVFGS
jgi:uncharacterized membrane protein YidH (DUF202 family)